MKIFFPALLLLASLTASASEPAAAPAAQLTEAQRQAMDLGASQQRRPTFSLRTNLLSDAATNINIGADMSVGRKWTVGLTSDMNFWKFSDGKRWKHWWASPEARWWWCDNTAGSFILMYATAGQYNIGGVDFDFKFLGTDFGKLKDSRFQGWGVGAGAGYGYSWLLGRHWNLEALLAAGWLYTRYDQYSCRNCGKKEGPRRTHNYFGLTRAALNLVYTF